MTDTIKTNNKLDNYGLLTDHMTDSDPKYNFAKIRAYCKLHKKNLAELTEAEIEKFRSN